MSESEEVVSEPVEAERIPVEISDEIPTVVVGKKKKIAEPQTLPELVTEPIEEKPKPKRASRACVSTKAPPPPPPPEPVPEPITPAPKKSVRMKSGSRAIRQKADLSATSSRKAAAAPIETALEPVEEPVSSKRLLSDLTDFSARIQELHRMNEQHRKNVYREPLGGMV